MKTCPYCGIEIHLKELPHQGLFNSFRICPNCGGKFTVDTYTKYRQAIFIIIALVSLIFTIFLYFHGIKWIVPSLVSYVILGVMIYWGNKQLYLVPAGKNKNQKNGT